VTPGGLNSRTPSTRKSLRRTRSLRGLFADSKHYRRRKKNAPTLPIKAQVPGAKRFDRGLSSIAVAPILRADRRTGGKRAAGGRSPGPAFRIQMPVRWFLSRKGARAGISLRIWTALGRARQSGTNFVKAPIRNFPFHRNELMEPAVYGSKKGSDGGSGPDFARRVSR
jgi:hypothetical protein